MKNMSYILECYRNGQIDRLLLRFYEPHDDLKITHTLPICGLGDTISKFYLDVFSVFVDAPIIVNKLLISI